jgi:hypothetical protein
MKGQALDLEFGIQRLAINVTRLKFGMKTEALSGIRRGHQNTLCLSDLELYIELSHMAPSESILVKSLLRVFSAW